MTPLVVVLVVAHLGLGEARAAGPSDLVEALEARLPRRILREEAMPWILGASGAILTLSLAVLILLLRRRRGTGDAGPVPERQLRDIADPDRMRQEFDERLKELSAPLKAKMTRLSTFFMRLQSMLKADTKTEFFKTFSDALVNGFGIDRCALWFHDRTTGVMTPMVFHVQEREARGGRAKVSESRSPALAQLSVTPGDDNLVGYVGRHGGSLTRSDAGRDPARAHLIDPRNPFAKIDPVRTEVACTITTVDSVTQAESFIGVLALGPMIDGSEWTAAEGNLLAAFATMAGVAFDRADLLELTAAELASTHEQSSREREQRKRIRGILDQVVSSTLAERLLSRPEELDFKGEMVEATVFFSDVVGFTTYSENRDPQEVVRVLNEYLAAMTEVIQESEGILDKFVGDEIVAHWGALPRIEDHAIRAVRTAFRMRSALAELTRRWEEEGLEPLKMGMGISTGPMLFGCIGSPKKIDFTVMGDAVNLGARLEALTRKYPHDLIISEATYEAIRDQVDAELLGQISLKGKESKVRVYGVRGVA